MEEKNKPILFCDFDGVLSHDKYWRSLSSDVHNEVQKLLFYDNKTIVNDWMRGKYTAEQINQLVSEKIGIPFEQLWDIFVNDCRTTTVAKEFLEKLSDFREDYIVILITGNMDSFSRFTHPALNLEKYFDHISNSFYEGIHKTDNNGELFLKYANEYNVSLEKCIILDDSINVCNLFQKLGGKACLITPEQDVLYYLNKLN